MLQLLTQELKQGLRAIYGDTLKGVYLFGSYARGEQSDDSDVDVVIVLEHLRRYGEEIERTGELISSISLKYNLTVSRVFCDLDQWNHSQLPLFLNIRSEAVAI
ncbi:MAG: nucleotidyltransferase domain-containing protein [Anaerolineae bacterium]|nr:nucleotidyltransferase domain-containing protein [Anaerolineae bacterium]